MAPGSVPRLRLITPANARPTPLNHLHFSQRKRPMSASGFPCCPCPLSATLSLPGSACGSRPAPSATPQSAPASVPASAETQTARRFPASLPNWPPPATAFPRSSSTLPPSSPAPAGTSSGSRIPPGLKTASCPGYCSPAPRQHNLHIARRPHAAALPGSPLLLHSGPGVAPPTV